MGELDDAVVVDLPLRGDWAAYHTPGSAIPSHGTDQLGQRYAYDLIRVDERGGWHFHPASGARASVLGVRTSECYGWGEPVHAPFDGVVVQARDGLPERGWIHPVRELALVLRTAVTFRPSKLQQVLGDHVIARSGDVFALFAHFTTGSVAVREGQSIQTGDLLGRVGHTGNSTAPHLHFHLMDGPDPMTAKGIACAFREYDVRRDRVWERVCDGIPTKTDRFRSVHRQAETALRSGTDRG
jgi:murein DD-endopeptidase MepM/ murein hydrolase activator NlpD